MYDWFCIHHSSSYSTEMYCLIPPAYQAPSFHINKRLLDWLELKWTCDRKWDTAVLNINAAWICLKNFTFHIFFYSSGSMDLTTSLHERIMHSEHKIKMRRAPLRTSTILMIVWALCIFNRMRNSIFFQLLSLFHWRSLPIACHMFTETGFGPVKIGRKVLSTPVQFTNCLEKRLVAIP